MRYLVVQNSCPCDVCVKYGALELMGLMEAGEGGPIASFDHVLPSGVR